MNGRWRGILAAIVLVVVLGIAVLWRMTRLPPAWYAPPDAANQNIVDLADRVEYRIVQEAQKIRPDAEQPWTLRVREEQINAWLAARLQKWIEHEEGVHWPENLGTPQIKLEPDGISVAIPILTGGRTRFIIARINPMIVQGKLRLELDRVALGRLALPGEPTANLVNTLSQSAPDALQLPQINIVIDWLNRREAIDPVFELVDGRRIRLMDLRLDEAMLDVTGRTLDADER